MNMLRALVAMAVCLLAGATTASAACVRIDATVSLAFPRDSNGRLTVLASGRASVYNQFGNVDNLCNLWAETNIKSADTGQQVGTNPYGCISSGSITCNAQASATEGSCYQAIMSVQALAAPAILYTPWDATTAVASPVVCAPAQPDGPAPRDNCPIVIDLDGESFRLGDLAEPVTFDLDADGVPEKLSWTRRGSRVGFLARDLNHNGVIDDGTELFGWATRLADGSNAEVGYRALAELDSPALGGNGDGVVDSRDAGFRDLVVWVDANHDGVTQPGELVPLPAAGILALNYDYGESRRRDGSGNLFRYRSSALIEKPGKAPQFYPTWDVIFAESP